MSDGSDWKKSLTATERYENIQKIQHALSLDSSQTKSAFALENEAYSFSTSRTAYDAACRLPGSARAVDPDTRCTNAGAGPPADDVCDSGDGGDIGVAEGQDEEDEEAGVRIGRYQNCRYVASGVTAEVYRCKTRALKVIVETHNIAPHDPFREAKILAELKRPCVPLLETFRDQEQRFVLVFPYVPLTLAALLEGSAAPAVLTTAQIRLCFRDVFRALADIHGRGIIHRDVKPAAVLLASADGPALLSDFGTAWHPRLSTPAAGGDEPADAKILDVGTGPYRAPEALFGDRSYGAGVDLWAAGAMLAEACRPPPASPLFESRAAHEDGNQLGLILSIFKTIGSPTRESWPEAASLKTPPFEMYRVFERRPWAEILRGVEPAFVELVAALVKYGGGRATAEQALQFECLR